MKNVLIICHDDSVLSKISKIKHHNGCRYILASDDPKVHEASKKFLWIDEICWIEKMESYFIVAEDVIKYLEIINKWLRTLANKKWGFSEELLFWVRQCEGGMTTQRIQDLLLLIRSYEFLFDHYSVSRVISISQVDTLWEDSVLLETAKIRNINVTVIGNDKVKILFNELRQHIYQLSRSLYYIFNLVRVKYRRTFDQNKIASNSHEIMFQLCGSAKKHVNNIVPIMKDLQDLGYKPIALCWNMTERYTAIDGFNQIINEGLQAERLEQRVPIFTILSGVVRSMFTIIIAKSNYFRLFNINYESIPLAPLLWSSFQYHFAVELLPRYVYDIAIRDYFKSHNPVGVKIWSEGVTPEGALVLNKLNEKIKPLVFYWNWVPVESPYFPKFNKIDMYLAGGKWHKKYYENRGVPAKNISVVGMSQFDNISYYLKSNSKNSSFIKLGISRIYTRYILYDPNLIMRGYMSGSEQALALSSLVNFAQLNPRIAIIIKPHPSDNIGIIEKIDKKNHDLENIIFLEKDILPYDALNVADVIITKYSTLALEAMLLRTPVISLILDQEERWEIYRDAVSYAYNIKDLIDLLHNLMNDDYFYHWCQKQHINQKQFLTTYLNYSLDKCDETAPYKSMAVSIDEKLTKKLKREY